MKIILGPEVTMNQVMTEKPLLWVFFKICDTCFNS